MGTLFAAMHHDEYLHIQDFVRWVSGRIMQERTFIKITGYKK